MARWRLVALRAVKRARPMVPVSGNRPLRGPMTFAAIMAEQPEVTVLHSVAGSAFSVTSRRFDAP